MDINSVAIFFGGLVVGSVLTGVWAGIVMLVFI